MNYLILKPIIFFIILILSAYWDLKKMIVPDFITYPGILLGLVFTFMEDQILWPYYLIGGIGGFLLVLLISILGKKILKKEVLGGGDIKLIFVIGLFLGYAGLLITFILSSLSAILVIIIMKKDFKAPVPYAFYLSLAGIISWIFVNYSAPLYFH